MNFLRGLISFGLRRFMLKNVMRSATYLEIVQGEKSVHVESIVVKCKQFMKGLSIFIVIVFQVFIYTVKFEKFQIYNVGNKKDGTG